MSERLERLIEEWVDMELHGDVKGLQELLTDDFAGIGPMGFVLSKEQWLGRYASGAFTYRALRWDELTIREYDGTAIVVGIQDQEGVHQGGSTVGRFRGSQVYVQVDGRWRLAGVQLSLMPGTPIPGAPPVQGGRPAS